MWKEAHNKFYHILQKLVNVTPFLMVKEGLKMWNIKMTQIKLGDV